MIAQDENTTSPLDNNSKENNNSNKDGWWQRQPKEKRLLYLAVLVVIILSSISIIFHGHKNRSKPPLPPVVTTTARSTNVPIYLSALGSVIPTASVTVRTQINGQLTKVLFQEGQQVHAGDLLAEIDSRPFAAQLTQYQGQLKRDMALLNNAKLDLARYTKLAKQDSIAKQTLDTQKSLVDQYAGTVKADQGLIENAELNLVYCKITSPIDGTIGLRLVDAGNFVQTSNSNGLVVINTTQPITATFAIPEDSLQDVLQQVNAGNKLTVEAYDRTQNQQLAIGTLLSLDNQIDPTTGTLKLKAQFANKQNLLFPNQFVNIKLLVKTLYNATVVSTAAIRYSTTGNFVYLLTANNIVKMIPVVVGATYKYDTVVSSGVKPGDKLVVEGADALTDGMQVAVNQNGQNAVIPIRTK